MKEMEKSAQAGAVQSYDLSLDTSGLYCPEPVMLLHNKVRDMDAGQVLKVLATDPATTRDIPKFCAFLGHELLSQQQLDGDYVYLIRKCDQG